MALPHLSVGYETMRAYQAVRVTYELAAPPTLSVGACPRAAAQQLAPHDGRPIGVGQCEARHGAERHLM